MCRTKLLMAAIAVSWAWTVISLGTQNFIDTLQFALIGLVFYFIYTCCCDKPCSKGSCPKADVDPSESV